MRGLCLRFPWAGAAPANRRLSQRAEGSRDAAPACRDARLLPGALAEHQGETQSPRPQRCCQGEAMMLLEQTQSKAWCCWGLCVSLQCSGTL